MKAAALAVAFIAFASLPALAGATDHAVPQGFADLGTAAHKSARYLTIDEQIALCQQVTSENNMEACDDYADSLTQAEFEYRLNAVPNPRAKTQTALAATQ